MRIFLKIIDVIVHIIALLVWILLTASMVSYSSGIGAAAAIIGLMSVSAVLFLFARKCFIFGLLPVLALVMSYLIAMR